MNRPCRVLIASKYRLAGEALCEHLARQSDRYQALFAYCLALDKAPREFAPDVVVIWCGNCPCGVPAIRALFPEAKCVVVGRAPGEELQIRWMKEGAHGIVDEASHEVDSEHLAEVIRVVLADQVWAPRSIISRLVLETTQPARQETDDELTDREREMMSLLHLGLSNAQIGRRLFISEKTVKGHLTNLYRKLQVKNRLQASLKLRELQPDHLRTVN